MTVNELNEAIENEWYIVRYSGETPEIAYNSAIYQLTRAQDGPQLFLETEQVQLLKNAAVDRYTEIVLRDLHHANSGTAIYRGIARSIINYRRFCTFCSRQQLQVGAVRRQAAEALLLFLDNEIDRLQSGNRSCIINCSYQELQDFALELGVELGDRHRTLAEHCPLSS
jgi:hypothetical protein